MRITFIGSGNVATHMAAALKNAGHRILQVYSPNMHNAAILAYHVGAEAVSDMKDMNAEADLYIISVKDDAIEKVAAHLSAFNKLIVHTSGATSLDTLSKHAQNAGVFYPLQTFSKQKEVNFWSVPLCIEGASEEITKQLFELAHTISNNVYRISSDQRKILHLAAVFACNFPNYLYHVSQQLLAQHQLDFDLLKPLITETADKIQSALPVDVQTGPAIRNDEQTMQAHINLLHNNPFLQNLYLLMSEGIMKMEKN